MGGGGVMRAAAAKVGGIGVINKSLRGFTAVPTSEQSVRNTSCPVLAVHTSSQQNLTAASGDSVNQRMSWDVDDWEFAGGQEESLSNSGEPMPRVVFGGSPSLEEAKAATSELKDALDQVYGTPFAASQVSECVENEVPSDYIVSSPVSKHALRAFSLLKESPVAQNVVASIASDPNVWNAVLQNEALKEYIISHKTYTPCTKTDLIVEESVADSELQCRETPGKVDDTKQSENSGNIITEVLQNIKFTMTDMVTNISNFVHIIFGVPEADHKSTDSEGKSGTNFMDTLRTSSFMALAVMVITVIVLKRV